jgi:hypothetical protein
LVWGCSKDSDNTTPAPTSTTCNYTLNFTSQSIGASGGAGAIVVTRTTGSCGWTASSDASFLTVVNLSGPDSANLNFTLSANTSTDSRTGHITVSWTGGSAQLTVTQAGAAAPPPPPAVQPCTYTLDPAAVTFPATGGTGQSTLTVTGQNCSWTAFSNQGWITINAGFTGTTTGTIAYTVAPNPGSQRFGRIIVNHTVGTSDLSFTQDAPLVSAAASLSVSPNPCSVSTNGDPPNTDPARNTNRLNCTFDASASTAVSGISSYEFWLGSPPASVDSFLLANSTVPIITNPLIGCGYTGGGDVTINVYVIVNPNSGAPIISAPVALTLQKNGGC